ncbi:MAG: filamentous hemagglutinin N-terminal protein, partial [Verrucomicrobiaceae bacterium]|nr:filamentous hemagglutinin N-terminal protein [Verrucomicrobiaceae bacterium]
MSAVFRPLRSVVAFSLVFMGCLWALPCSATTSSVITLPCEADTFVTPGQANELLTANFGADTSLEVSGANSVKGQAEIVLRFDLSGLFSSLISTFGVDGWKIDGVSLALTDATPPSSFFNTSSNAGSINVQWIPSDAWVEGPGTTANPSTPLTCLRWNNLAPLMAGAESQGVVTCSGSQTTATYMLMPTLKLLNELSSAGKVSFILSAGDPSFSAVFNSRTAPATATRPQLVIKASTLPSPTDPATLKIASPARSASFGSKLTLLPNGNMVVIDSGYSLSTTTTRVGAVYLYDTNAVLISTLTGSTAGDKVGSGGITVLTNGNFVISSPEWHSGAAASAGAVTWCSASSGLNGNVSAANSLLGGTASDRVGASVIALPGGNYLSVCSSWLNGQASPLGAVTWCDGTTGITGAVSAANSLVGSTAGDFVGYNVCVLANGNYVVASSLWDNGSIANVGAVTWGSGTSGITGPVSAANSLVGTTADDYVGSNTVALSNGHFVVASPSWHNAGTGGFGAVTWVNGTTGLIGAVTTSNSLVGSSASVFALTNGNYVAVDSAWSRGGVSKQGSVTWGDGSAGTVGVVAAANSLVGASTSDQMGSGSVFPLANGNYVVVSPYWNGNGVFSVGAVTLCTGIAPTSGTASAANSLVGSTTGDMSAISLIRLANSNYVVQCGHWNNGPVMLAGAVTWGSGFTGATGPISSSNSLVGDRGYTSLGQSVTALSNGNYVVATSIFSTSALNRAGAVTWADGNTGITGVISSQNSMIGEASNCEAGRGGITPLTNGNYVVVSAGTSGQATSGAVTWMNGTLPTSGTVSAANSVIGSSLNDYVGGSAPIDLGGGNVVLRGGIIPLSDGNYVISSPSWNRGTVVDAGAVTWCNGTQATNMVVSSANSLAGARDYDMIGFYDSSTKYGGVFALGGGRYVVSSPYRDASSSSFNTGAVTLGYGSQGIVGEVSAINSVLGTVSTGLPLTQPGTAATLSYVYDAQNGRLVVARPLAGKPLVGQLSVIDFFTPAPGIEVARTDDTLVNNGDSIIMDDTALGSSTSLSLAIRNPGLGSLTSIASMLTGDDSSHFAITASPAASLSGPGGLTFVTVTFTPSTAGLKTADLSLASTDTYGNSPFVIHLQAQATAPRLEISAQGAADSQATTLTDASTQVFGSLAYTVTAQASNRVAFTLANNGQAPLSLTSLGIDGSNADDFVLDQSLSTSPVAAGGSTSFTITFLPTGIGTRAATLTLHSNDPDHGTFTLQLTGNGKGVAGTAGLSSSVYTVPQGASSVVLTLTRAGGTLPFNLSIHTSNGLASTVPPFAAAVATGVAATSDYATLAGADTATTFSQGETLMTVTIPLFPKKGTAIPNKRFNVTLSDPTNGVVLVTSVATVQILAADVTKPTLTVTTPGTAKTLSAALPYMVTGMAGDAHGIASVTVALNGGAPVPALLGSAKVPKAVPFSLPLMPVPGPNTLVVTATDLKGIPTVVTRSFTFERRYFLTIIRNVPPAYSLVPNNSGTVTMTAPAAAATPFVGVAGHINQQTAQVLPGTTIKLTATAKTACAFSNWTGLPTVYAGGNVYTFTMPAADLPVAATFVANPFGGAAGTGSGFQGLIHASTGTVSSNATEGFLAGTLTASTGAFTGKILVDGVSQPLAATFFGDGSSVFTVGTAKQASLVFGGRSLTLSYNAGTDNNQITATLASGAGGSTGVAARAVYSAAHKLQL